MGRNRTSILAGTVFVTFLFSAMETPPTGNSGSGSLLALAQGQTKGTKGGSAASPTDRYLDEVLASTYLSEVPRLAADRYQGLLKQLIDEECQGSDANCSNPANFIIALVPDPVHTHLALSFDRATEAIQEALQDEDYTYVRSVMPWDPATHPESDQVVDRVAAL